MTFDLLFLDSGHTQLFTGSTTPPSLKTCIMCHK